MPTEVSTTPSQSMDPLYARNPGAVQTEAVRKVTAPAEGSLTSNDAKASVIGNNNQAEKISLGGYSAEMAADTPDTKASNTLNEITAQKSPLMQRAQAQGMLTAGRRGLQNSSIAAGAAMGEMVDRAAPIAMQDARTVAERNLANQSATNVAKQFTVQQANVGTLENARAQNDLETTKAQLETAVAQGNAQQANVLKARLAELTQAADTANVSNEQQTALANTEAENKMRSDVLAANAELNKQFLTGTQAMDLASIQGRYNQLIAANSSASSLFEASMTGIRDIMSSTTMSPDQKAQAVKIQQTQLDAGLRLVDSMNALDLGAFTTPGAATTGTGKNTAVVSTPGTGATATTQVVQPAAPAAPATKNPYKPGSLFYRAWANQNPGK